ncbi:MAG: Fe-S cluster assembly protein SufD, partial [Bacteroidota bacterium]|nr:Fe-S cluster assembly protein SufD [Bacteroidota bacterium]
KNGVTIEVDKNLELESPIEILFFNNTKKDNFIQYRNKIVVGDNAQVKFVERIQNLSEAKSFVNHFTQIAIGKNANVEYNKIQDNTKNSILVDVINISQKSDSVCNVNTLIFGGEFIRNNLNFEQNGKNCESNMNGISILDNKQFADNHTFVDHKKANCTSNEMYKGIYLGQSKGVFNGKIMVRPDAQKIDAFQSNNNLLLSNSATIDSKPQLEIYADDVKCSHGCTIGQLDDNALFYMRSRGIGLKEARAVLTYAFASEAVNNISIPEVKKMAQKLIAKKLNVTLDFNL